MRSARLILVVASLAVGLAGCGHNVEERAATGAAAGLVVAGPIGAAVGAGVGVVVNKADEGKSGGGKSKRHAKKASEDKK